MLTVSLVLLCLIFMFPISVSAAAEGTMMSNAVQAKFDQTYLKTWNKDTDHLNHYVKIQVPETGILTITATKPFDSEGEYGRLYFTLYDDSGEPIWGNNSFQSVDNAKSEYKVKVGVCAGTYYLTLKPGFSVRSGLIETYYSISFQKNAYCEVEPNGSGYLATTVIFNQVYTGYYGTAGSDYEESEYYKFPVIADHTYRIAWYNFSAMDRTSTIVRFLSPDGKDYGIDLGSSVNSEGLNYGDKTVPISGTAYLRIYNFNGAQFEYKFIITDITCEKSGHDYNAWTTTKAATCLSEGTQSRTCTGCGNTETKSIGKLSHSYGSWTAEKEATCASEGVQTRTCSGCGNKETKSISKLSHSYNNWIVTKNATCTSTGEKTRACVNCESLETATIEITPHDCDKWDITLEATCENDGRQEAVCNICNLRIEEAIQKRGHLFDNACDTSCANCEKTRIVYHDYGYWQHDEENHWKTCNTCGKQDFVGQHSFEDATNTDTCQICNYEVGYVNESLEWVWIIVGILAIGAVVAVVIIKRKQ